jgi:hypothetical protein
MANELATQSSRRRICRRNWQGLAMQAAYVAANGDATQQAKADTKFKTALTLAQLARERALRQL